MAGRTRRSTRYETYGNVAYDPAWSGGAAAIPQREEILRPRPQVRPKERTMARPRVQVREAGAVAPFAVIGFLAVGVFAALLLVCCVQLTIVNDETAQLRSQLTQLEQEQATLLAQYELAYDLQTIEAQVTADGSMVKPGSKQIVMLDLSEPDSVVVYGAEQGARGMLEQFGGLMDKILT